MFIGYTSTAEQYRLDNQIDCKILLSPDVIFKESSSYFVLEDFDNSAAHPCYTPATYPWEEQLA